MTRPLPIEARLKPEGACVGVGGKVAPLATEPLDSLLLRLLGGTPTPSFNEETNTKMQTKSKSCKEKKLIASLRERLQHAKMIFFGSRALFPDLIVKKIGSRSFLYSKKCYFSSRAIRSFLSKNTSELLDHLLLYPGSGSTRWRILVPVRNRYRLPLCRYYS